jgi:hypothetical protein
LIPYDAYARFHNLGHGREALAGLLAELRALGEVAQMRLASKPLRT